MCKARRPAATPHHRVVRNSRKWLSRCKARRAMRMPERRPRSAFRKRPYSGSWIYSMQYHVYSMQYQYQKIPNTKYGILNTVYRIRNTCRASRGFTLIETMVAIALLTISIVAPMSLTTQSLASAYYARDQI